MIEVSDGPLVDSLPYSDSFTLTEARCISPVLSDVRYCRWSVSPLVLFSFVHLESTSRLKCMRSRATLSEGRTLLPYLFTSSLYLYLSHFALAPIQLIYARPSICPCPHRCNHPCPRLCLTFSVVLDNLVTGVFGNPQQCLWSEILHLN
jgi:hypothetical protein